MQYWSGPLAPHRPSSQRRYLGSRWRPADLHRHGLEARYTMTTAGEILIDYTNVFLAATDRSRRLEEIEAVGLAFTK